jgi:phage terminase large subunit-like protein
VQAIAYDQWNAAQLTSKLKTQDVPLQMFIQGPKSYHPAMQAFERAYISEKLSYGIDPVLTWCASNLVTRTDANLNMAPDKKRSSEKIDDMVALLMAVGISQSEPEEESSIYETPGFSLFG